MKPNTKSINGHIKQINSGLDEGLEANKFTLLTKTYLLKTKYCHFYDIQFHSKMKSLKAALKWTFSEKRSIEKGHKFISICK